MKQHVSPDKKNLHSVMRIIELNKARLNKGEVIHVRLKDGFLTIYNEYDEETNENKIITLVDEFDYSLNFPIEALSRGN